LLEAERDGGLRRMVVAAVHADYPLRFAGASERQRAAAGPAWAHPGHCDAAKRRKTLHSQPSRKLRDEKCCVLQHFESSGA